MGTTLSRGIIYETADARNVGREMPSLEIFMRIFIVLGPCPLSVPVRLSSQPGKRKPTNLSKANGWLVRPSRSKATRHGDGLPSYGADVRLALRSLRRPATRARRLPRLRAVVSSASTGCREPSVPARVPGP